MWYHVINRNKGNLSIMGSYKTSKAAENRLDNVFGGESYMFASYSREPETVLREFRDAEVKTI
jgi:hypothetical protein